MGKIRVGLYLNVFYNGHERTEHYEFWNVGFDDDGDDADQHDGDMGDYINIPPTTQGRDHFAAEGPQTACNGRTNNMGYLPAQMYYNRQAKNRVCSEGDSVLLLLPTERTTRLGVVLYKVDRRVGYVSY